MSSNKSQIILIFLLVLIIYIVYTLKSHEKNVDKEIQTIKSILSDIDNDIHYLENN